MLGIIAVAIALGGAGFAQAPPPAALPFVLKQVGPGVYAAIDGPERKALANAGFVIGDDGVLVIDSLFTPEAAQSLVAEIRRITPKPIRYVVNTHYHADHTGGDQVLRDAGAIIIAHKNVQGWVRTNNINLFGDRITPELKRGSSIGTAGCYDRQGSHHLAGVAQDRGEQGAGPYRRRPHRVRSGREGLVHRRHVVAESGAQFDRWVGAGVVGCRGGFRQRAERRREAFRAGPWRRRGCKGRVGIPRLPAQAPAASRRGAQAGLKGDALVLEVAPKMRANYPDWTISDRSIAAEVRYMNDELAGTSMAKFHSRTESFGQHI